MSANILIDKAMNEKPLEFYKAFEDAMSARQAAIVDNQKRFFAQNFLGAKPELDVAPEVEVEEPETEVAEEPKE